MSKAIDEMTLAEISAELDGLTSDSDAPSCEPVAVEGWYASTDGTYSRYYWTAGGELRRSATLRDPLARERYEALEARGAELFR